MHRRRLETAIRICLAVFALYTVGRFGIDQIRPPGMIPNDFLTFPHACERLDAGAPIYRPDDPSPFKYSPTFLLAFRYTYGLLSPALSWILWSIVCAFGFAWATSWLWIAALPLEELSSRIFAALLVAFGVFHWHGFIEHFSYGQGDMIVYALFIGAVAASCLKRQGLGEGLAALGLGAILVTKPQGAILLAYFALAGRWRLLALTAGATVALLLLPLPFLGATRMADMITHWRVVLSRQSVEFMTGNLNQSIAATVARWSGRREMVYAWTTIAVAGAGLAVAKASWRRLLRRARPVRDPRAAAWLACFVLQLYALVSPLSWRWFTFVWLPVGVIVGARALRARRAPLTILLSIFALNGLLLQTFIAHALGIAEVDDLSRAGLYTIGNVLLFAAVTLVVYSRKPNDVSS